MKKIISLTLSLMLLLGILAVPALAEDRTCGTLSYLNMTEEEDSLLSTRRLNKVKILYLDGVLVGEDRWLYFDENKVATQHFYDSLNALLMGLQAGEVGAIKVPYYTGKYLCSSNDKLMMPIEYHPEKATSDADTWALNTLSDGYAFMLKEDNTALRDQLDAQITAMKEDGTLQKLVDEHIIKVADGGEPVAIAFEKFEGDPVKVAVTGDLPPMDYVAPDGSFAGFNTAVLAEIGKRLQKNIELVQVDSVGRALALSEGNVDVVFWTRGISEGMMEHRRKDGMTGNEEITSATDEEKAILREGKNSDEETKAKLDTRDMPAGTIITQPYFSDIPLLVVLK